jgi:type IV pilus biogenesis protein CpaD/CtpE
METTMKNAKTKTVLMLAAALAAGCSSSKPAQVDQTSDQVEHNRLLVRMALTENVYNGTAADRAVYPKDFDFGSATLNPLGQQRVEMLIHAYRGATGRIVVLQGDEPDAVHAERIATVRQQFADAGFDKEKVNISKGGHLGAGSSSERAIISFDRLMSEYRPKEGGKGAQKPAADSTTTK